MRFAGVAYSLYSEGDPFKTSTLTFSFWALRVMKIPSSSPCAMLAIWSASAGLVPVTWQLFSVPQSSWLSSTKRLTDS